MTGRLAAGADALGLAAARNGAEDWASVSGITTDVFDFATRSVLGSGSGFCFETCPLANRHGAGRCDPQAARRFGCYEAERWGAEYIYYCPASLVFTATLVRDAGAPVYGLVCGPLVLGAVEDLLAGPQVERLMAALPARSAADLGALARTQQAVCDARSRPASPARNGGASRAPIDTAGPERAVGAMAANYPLDLEDKLTAMIRRGDRAGASELINRLLGALYLANTRDFNQLRRSAGELVTVFSRAAISGGADAEAIFGAKRAMDARVARCDSLDSLSALLVSVFHRFVSYVFDFSQFQHANALRKVVEYINEHYPERITLADAAGQASLSPGYLSSVFSAEMGLGFSAYVQEVRIEKGKQMLLGTGKSVAEVAAATGFADQSYFAKVFARSEGVSPSEFRRGVPARG